MRALPLRVWFVILLAGLLQFGPGVRIAKAERGVRTEKTLKFSGLVWKVKSSATRVGPGSNYFSDSDDNVWIDNAGSLHVKISQREGKWYCAEIISKDSFGFGTYGFHVATPLAKLDPNITLGLFTWSDTREYSHREIDIECGKWGKINDTNNAQFVVQPYQNRGRLLRCHIPEDADAVLYSFMWQSDRVSFSCRGAGEPTSSVTAAKDETIKEWNFTGNPIPKPGDENARINLWLCSGRPPIDSDHTEVVIKKFEFLPSNDASTKKSADKVARD